MVCLAAYPACGIAEMAIPVFIVLVATGAEPFLVITSPIGQRVVKMVLSVGATLGLVDAIILQLRTATSAIMMDGLTLSSWAPGCGLLALISLLP